MVCLSGMIVSFGKKTVGCAILRCKNQAIQQQFDELVTTLTVMMIAASIMWTSLSATAAMAIACAVLSVFVVARRWAFIGEGISHSGFGGAGLAWLFMLIVPALADRAWIPYAAVVLFCLAAAIAIGAINRGDRVAGDAAIGIFLVASLALGF